MCKFSYSNENELLLSTRNCGAKSPKQLNKLNSSKKLKSKAKSEEKFTNSPNYHIFLAKYPHIKSHLQKFMDKRNCDKTSNSQVFSPLMSPKENMLKLQDPLTSGEKRLSNYIINEFSQKNPKNPKKFKEDELEMIQHVKASGTVMNNFLNPVLEEKKEEYSCSNTSSSSDDSGDTINSKQKKFALKINTKRASNKKESMIPTNIANIDNNNPEEDNENDINLQKGYLSDENDKNAGNLKRTTK